MHRTSWLFPIVLVACFHSTSEDCSDGTFCPQGLRCVGHGGGCFDPLQCSSGDGEPCGVNGTCAGGECIASVCGDGIVGRGETCDDANQLSHDGCSSQCQTEMPDCQPLAMLDACAAETWQMFVEPNGGRVLVTNASPLAGCGTYAIDQDTFTSVAPFPGGERQYFGLATDHAHGNAVLFGGVNLIGNPEFADTYLWNGSAWTQATPATKPSARDSLAMADLPGGRVVLFGGQTSSQLVGDTWTWDGATWHASTPANPPPPRMLHAMAYDFRHQVVVMTGGAEMGGGTPPGDTWTWDGAAWTPVPSATLSRDGHVMAYDAARGRIVAAGGTNGTASHPVEEYDGTSWQPLVSATCANFSVSAGTNLALAYDPRGRRLLAFDSGSGELWQLRWDIPSELEESCVPGEDADGDGLAGCADPDCWGYCTPDCPPGATCP